MPLGSALLSSSQATVRPAVVEVAVVEVAAISWARPPAVSSPEPCPTPAGAHPGVEIATRPALPAMASSPVRRTCGQHIVPNLECKENSCFQPNGSGVSGRRDIRNLRARLRRGFRYTTYSARHKAGDPSPRGRFPGPWEPLERLWGSKAVLPAPTSAFMPIPSAVPPGADGREGGAVGLLLNIPLEI